MVRASLRGPNSYGSEMVDGIHDERLAAWFRTQVPEATHPLTYDLITGGHSNLTFRVQGAAGDRWVLRRPPLGQVLATAHDVVREARIMSALAPTDVPVPEVVGICDDNEVNDAPFYVMRHVDGAVIRSAEEATALTVEQRRRTSESLMETLAKIHSVDLNAVGLADLSRHEGYIARQLKRWYGQLQQSEQQVVGGIRFDALHTAHEELTKAIPEQGPATVVHGDFRLDNCLIGSDGSVAAVLDWELCTLGDPLADLGLLCVYWADPGDPAVLPEEPPTTLDGFFRRNDLIETYGAASGRDLSQLNFYVAFGYWKLACILAGVYARYAGGSMGATDDETVEGFRSILDRLMEATTDSIADI